LVADLEHNVDGGGKKPEVKGVLGLSINITDLKARTRLKLDNRRFALEEQAARDLNSLKSQFLANVSVQILYCTETKTNGLDVSRIENTNSCKAPNP
jgi:hypothetical protein